MGIRPNGMAWPLLPKAGYKAPLTQATQSIAQSVGFQGQDHDGQIGMQIGQYLMNNPQMLQQLGIDPEIMQMLMSEGGKLNIEQILNGGKEDYMELLKNLAIQYGPTLARLVWARCGGA